jgi:type IV pilus secretin PilQ/predicted competence protein
MTKTIIRLTAFGLGLILALAGLSQTGSFPAPVKATILPTRVNTRVVVDGAVLPAGVSPAYTPGREAVLVVDLGRLPAPPAAPLIPADEPPLVRDAQFLPAADGRTSLSLTLIERVPFRIWTEGTKTVIELIKIQRGGGDYLIAPDVQAELARTPRSADPLSILEPTALTDRLNIGARLGRKAIVNIFALDNPLRLVVDVFDSSYQGITATLPVAKHGVERIKIGQFKAGDPYAICRIVFDLREPRIFALTSGPDGLNVTFADPVVASPTAAVAPATTAVENKPKTESKIPAATAAVAPATTAVSSPEVKAPAKIEAPKIEAKPVPGTDPAAKKAEPFIPATPTPSKPIENKPPAATVSPATEAVAPPTTAIENKPKTEFKLPVSTAAVENKPKPESKTVEVTESAAVKIDPPPPAAPAKPKTETKSGLSPSEPQQKEAPQAEQVKPKIIYDPADKYSGDLISPRFKDADLRDVILWLGEKVELNVLFDNEVRGKVTCSFVDVPWDQFLDMILKSNKLGRMLEGNVLRIAPLGVLAEEEKAQLTLRQAVENSGPIRTKIFPLSYAEVKDVFEIVKSKKSERGEIVSDARTNSLIVSDVQEKIDLIDQIISTLDAPTRQVTIETRIIEVTSTFVRNLGIQWGARGVADPSYGNQTSLQFPNKILVDGAMIPEGIVTKGIGGPLGGYAVNLPAPAFSSSVGFSLANVLDTLRVDMAISAMETEGSGKIISSQRITAQNNKEASINQGRQIPVQTQANFTVTTQYVNAGLELTATPQITAEGTIIMTLDIKNNAADFANLVNGIPPITTQSAKTTVMVPDGGTTVIGGIYRVEDSVTREKVPLLHQIPILGALFKNLAKNRTNRELLIFITPRIQK